MPYKDPEAARARNKRYRQTNLEHLRAYHKDWREKNREKIRLEKQAEYEANSEAIKARSRAWSKANSERKIETGKAYYQATREKQIVAAKAWAQANPGKCSERRAKYRKAYPDRVRRQKLAWHTRRKQQNIGYKIQVALRNRLRFFVKRRNRSKSTMKLLGCDVDWIKAWLEIQFQPGMTWENHGSVWHIDHKRPCASFDLTDKGQQGLCFHWTNLQPLFASENIKKGAHYKEAA